MFSQPDKDFIVQLARQAIELYVAKKTKLQIEESTVPESVRAKRACFVTLTQDFELRGCIGHLEATQPLYIDIVDNAIAAATEDDRFNPVTVAELPTVDIEVSVLTEPVKVIFTTPTELLEKLTVGVHGVILSYDGHSATFLPQVWDELLDKKEFMAALSVKAGLAPSAWMESGVTVYTYQVEIVS